MGIRVIGQKKFEVTETELLQQDLLFYLDNPRVYSVLHENGHDNPTQTEIEEKILKRIGVNLNKPPIFIDKRRNWDVRIPPWENKWVFQR